MDLLSHWRAESANTHTPRVSRAVCQDAIARAQHTASPAGVALLYEVCVRDAQINIL